MKFEVNKNHFLVLISFMLIPLGLFIIYQAYKSNEPILPAIFAMLLCIVLGIYMIRAFFSSYYLVTENEFIIHFGFYKKTIKLDRIKSFRYTWNPISSQAWTFQRLEIMYDKYNMILLSTVKDKDRFFDVLEARCEHAIIKRN